MSTRWARGEAGTMVAAAIVGVTMLFTSAGPRAQATDKTTYVAVVDGSGKPVTDLQAGDFKVGEDNVVREITSVKRATEPIFIEILGDSTRSADKFVRDFRVSLTSFVHDVLAASPESQLSLMEFGQAAITITNFTSKGTDLEKGINRLIPKPDAESVLLEAIVEASKNFGKKAGPRRAIVAVNIEPGNEATRMQPDKIQEELRKGGASLWTLSLQLANQLNPGRDAVLKVLTQNSGGTRQFIAAPTGLEPWLKSYAAALTSQYAVTYKRPAGPAPQSMMWSVARQGVKVLASVWPPQ
jgi:hypothetical protein